MSLTAQTRGRASRSSTVVGTAFRGVLAGTGAIFRTTRGLDTLKRFAIMALVVAVIASAILPVIASAQTPPAPMSSIIVKMVAGLTAAQQADVIARNGGIELSKIPALRLHVIAIPTSDLASTLAAYQADPQ